jgi:hypothetical protein
MILEPHEISELRLRLAFRTFASVSTMRPPLKAPKRLTSPRGRPERASTFLRAAARRVRACTEAADVGRVAERRPRQLVGVKRCTEMTRSGAARTSQAYIYIIYIILYALRIEQLQPSLQPLLVLIVLLLARSDHPSRGALALDDLWPTGRRETLTLTGFPRRYLRARQQSQQSGGAEAKRICASDI